MNIAIYYLLIKGYDSSSSAGDNGRFHEAQAS